MRRTVVFSVVALLVLGLAAGAGAAAKKKHMGMGGGMAMGECGCDGHMEKLKTLGLDEKQTEAVQAIHLKAKKEMIRKKADREIAEVELKEVLQKDPVDMKAAEAAVKKIEGLGADLMLLHIRTREEVKANLTPEQKKKFAAIACDGPMGHKKGMKRKCDMQGMGGMEHKEHKEHKEGGEHSGHMSH